ncbi:MAG: hypothetical protein AAGD96_11335 [Chloroflexota bacterium]
MNVTACPPTVDMLMRFRLFGVFIYVGQVKSLGPIECERFLAGLRTGICFMGGGRQRLLWACGRCTRQESALDSIRHRTQKIIDGAATKTERQIQSNPEAVSNANYANLLGLLIQLDLLQQIASPDHLWSRDVMSLLAQLSEAWERSQDVQIDDSHPESCLMQRAIKQELNCELEIIGNVVLDLMDHLDYKI